MDKCKFYVSKIKYLKKINNAKGWRPGLERSSVIQNTPASTNIAKLQVFLGLTNYYQVYTNNIPGLRAPLKELLKKKKKKWNWTEKMPGSFPKNKRHADIRTIPTHFNPKEKLILASDASNVGIGAVLLYEDKLGSQRLLLKQVED